MVVVGGRIGRSVASLGAIMYIVTNLTTAMTCNCSSRISGWLILLKSEGLGKIGMAKRGRESSFIRSVFSWFPFVVGNIIFIAGAGLKTQLLKVEVILDENSVCH